MQEGNQLIETTSPLYGKRLVREIRSILNKAAEGVYFESCLRPSNPRVYHATYSTSRGWILLKTNQGPITVCSGQWDQFLDGYGRRLCATRRAR